MSEHSVKLVQMMDDKNVPRDTLRQLVRDSIQCQNKVRLEATAGYGCERHLLGGCRGLLDMFCYYCVES